MARYWDYSYSLIQKGYLHTYLNTYKYTLYDKVRVTLIVSGAHKWGGIYQLPTPTPNPTIKKQKDKLQGYVNSEENSPRSNTRHRGIQDRGSNGILMHIWISHTRCEIYHVSYFLFDKWELFFPDYNCLLLLPAPLLYSENQMALLLESNCCTPECAFLRRQKTVAPYAPSPPDIKCNHTLFLLLFTFSLGNSPLS